MLGFENYAEMTLSTKMAGSVENVVSMIDKLVVFMIDKLVVFMIDKLVVSMIFNLFYELQLHFCNFSYFF